jgi:hypothetical protein
MNYFGLSYGGIASEDQLRKGIIATDEQKTGPDFNYLAEAFDAIRAEAVRRDARARKNDILMESMPERYKMWYRGAADYRVGYIDNSRYQLFFSYKIWLSNGKSERIAGYGTVRLEQSTVGMFVRQKWTVEEFRITYRK